MSYRKVGTLEQCWYVLKYWLREHFRQEEVRLCRVNLRGRALTPDALT